MIVKHGHYGKFSGPYIIGNRNTPAVSAPVAPFMARAFWLLISSECGGRFGVVNMRDGTGVTAGLHQAVACYPRNTKEQGPLFKYLWKMQYVVSLSDTRLGSMLTGQDWYLTPDGLVDSSSCLVTGSKFRAVVTPTNGVTPRDGPRYSRSSGGG